MTIFLTRDEVKEYEKLKILSQLAVIKDKIELLKLRYGKTFEEFEKEVKEQEEDFEKWDDYIEWKAYRETKKTLTKKMVEIDNAQDIEITG